MLYTHSLVSPIFAKQDPDSKLPSQQSAMAVEEKVSAFAHRIFVLESIKLNNKKWEKTFIIYSCSLNLTNFILVKLY